MTLSKSLIAASLAVLLLSAPGLALAHDAPAHDAAHDAAHAAAAIAVGDLQLSGAFTRATLPNAPVGGGFLTIANTGAADDRLVSATSPASGEVQLHEMAMEGDVMKMRKLADGIPVPAGATVTLQPGGLHLMFIKLTGPMVEGSTVPVTLTFEKAGTVTLELSVQGVAADAPAMEHGMHSDAGADAHHGDAHHAASASVDQTGLSDMDAITAMQKALFDTIDNPLAMGPIVISGDYAVSDWAQGGMGGRALLRKTSKGWAIHLCAGEGLKDSATLVSIGVPEADAAVLASRLAEAEHALDAATIKLYDSFNGTMMVDEDLI